MASLMPVAARAQVGGGTDPATILNNIATFILGPFGQSVGILAIISAGFSWIFGYLGVYHVAAVVGGLVLTFVTVASELSATVVLYSGPWTTMTVAMFQALEGTSPGIAAAAATVLIICTLVPVALVYRLLRRHELSMLS